MPERLSALIVDDERLARRELRSMLESLETDVRVVAEAEDVADAVRAMSRARIDIVFLDVQLRGETDFVTAACQTCQTSKMCPDTGCRGEDVTLANAFESLIP